MHGDFLTDKDVAAIVFDGVGKSIATGMRPEPIPEMSPCGWCCETAHARNFFMTEAEARKYAAEWRRNGTWTLADVFPVYRHQPQPELSRNP